MADWFDENDPAKQDWFAANAPTDTLPGAVATQERPVPTIRETLTNLHPEGSDQYQTMLAELYRQQHPGNVAPLSLAERVRQTVLTPTPETPFDISGEKQVELPRRSVEEPLDELAQQMGFQQAGLTNEESGSFAGPFARFATSLRGGTPQEAEELRTEGARTLQKVATPENALLLAATGGSGPLAEAAQLAFAGQGGEMGYDAVTRLIHAKTPEEKNQAISDLFLAIPMAVSPLHPLLRERSRPIRGTPLEMPRLDPSVSMGPGTIAGDVSAALQRQEPTLADQITQPRVDTPSQEPLAPVTQETPEAAQAKRIEWEKKNEEDRRQQNITTMATRLYADAMREAKGPGPRDLAAESLLSQRKRAAQIVTGDRDVLAAFDQAHRMATERAEARHGDLLYPNRPGRYIDFTKPIEVVPEKAVEAPAAPEATAEAPISPTTVPAPVEPGTEPVINAPSTLPKKHIDDLIPFNIQGNKTSLLAKHIGGLVEKIAGISRRTIDAFAGSGTYTHFIRRLGLGKEGDILNEFDPLRAITHKQIRDNPKAVWAAVDRFREELDGLLKVKHGDTWTDEAVADRKLVSAFFRNKFPEFFEPGQDLVDLAKNKKPVKMKDSPELAGLYTLAQNQAFNFLPIQAELSPKQYPGTLKQPGYSVIAEGKGTVIKGFKSKTRNAPAIINAAGDRFKGLDIRQGDGWQLIRDEAREGDFVPVDTSYLNKITEKGLEKTANYNAETREDARPDVYLRKVSENLLPAWDRGARLLITNNYDPIVARQLRELGFEVHTAERSGSVSTSSKELVATNFDHETGEVYPRGEAVLRFATEEASRPVSRGGGDTVSAGGREGLASGPQGQDAAVLRRPAAVVTAPRVAPLVDIGALQARKARIEASIGPSRAIGQKVHPKIEAELAEIERQLPKQPPEAPVNAPGAATVAQETPGGVQVAEPAATAVAPEPYTQEAAAQRAAAPPEETGITKAAIAEQRETRELPAIERQKQIDFGESLDRAKATLAQDPMAGQRLVDELTAKPRSVTPEDTPLLIERMQQVQREFDAANRAVNEATTDADRTAAKARLEHARAEYDKTVSATQNATSRTGAGLNSVKMILKEDYSLARMESRKRAANNGEPLSEEQVKHTEALHAQIADLLDRVDQLERQRIGRYGGAGNEAVTARKSGKRLIDYTGEAAQKARERINRQLHGLGARPAPPTLLYDYAVVGADHLARGLTKFSDWSAQMIKEFGEKVKPHLDDLWKMARAVHDSAAKSFRSPEEVRLERYKTQLAKDTAGVTAKIQRGDFAKQTRQQLVLDKAAYKMKGNLQRLKNEFERGVAKDAYNKMSPGDKFWQHFVGVERAMKLSSPGVFQKLGLAAAVREVLAPVEAAGGYAASTFFPRLAKGTRYGADLRTITRAELKAKAALFTEGMKDAAENLKGRETGLEAVSDKYGRQPDFWYNRIGKFHAAVKAPVKRAEFVRSLEHRMDAAAKAGEDINHPEVMDRLATESALDANRAIFQQNTVVSHFFSMLDKAHPAAGRTARFLFPITKIPVNLFKEFVTYNLGAPAAAVKIGHAYWKGVETLEPAAREAIIRQLVKGSAGGAAILWGYYNSEKVHDFFASVPPWFEHTPIAMAIHEGSIIKGLEEQGTGTKYRPTEAYKDATKMAKYDIPFAYTVTGLTNALDPSNPNGWKDYLYGMIQSSVVPQVSSWTAKEMDKPTPFSIFDKPVYRPPTNVVEAVTQGIPGLRQDIPEYHRKERAH